MGGARQSGIHARYKTVVAYAYLGDMQAAGRAFRELWAAETHGVVQYHYALMALRFLTGYEQNHIMRVWRLTTDDDLSAGCASAIAYAEDHVSFLEHVGIENYGDREVQYRAVDMCPSSLKTAGYYRPSGYVDPSVMSYVPQPTSRSVNGAWPTPTATATWTPTATP